MSTAKDREEFLKNVNAKSKGEILLSDLYMDYVGSDISNGLSEEEIRNEVTKIYTKVNSSFDANFYTDKKTKKARFDINGFLSGMMGNFGRYSNIPRKFSAEQVNKIMEVPYQYKDQLLRMSMYFYVKTQEYKGILDYKATLLTYSNVLDVITKDMSRFDINDYRDNLYFIENYNLKSKLNQVTKILVRDDVYFAYELSNSSKANYVWKRLPSQYCQILGRDKFETYRVAFDFSYFSAYPDQLECFPDEFRDKYDQLRNKNKGRKKKISNVNLNTGSWMELDSSRAIAFKFDESVDYVLPYYSGLFLDLVRLSDLKDIEVVSAISDNYKLLHQLVPIDEEAGENEFLITGEFLTGFHENLVANSPEGVGVVTTPMKVEALTLKGNVQNAQENITSRQVSNIFTQSGTSSLLFNGSSTSSLGLNKNITVDESMMFRLLRQYELFMRKRLYFKNDKTYKYGLRFLDHTNQNTENVLDQYMKAGQSGFNTQFEINSVLGRSQLAFINNSQVIEELGINDKMQPFKSSHVGDGSTSSEQGDPKTEAQITEEGMQSRERDL